MQRIILIHPPVAKPCEPPAGIARLKGFIEARGHSCALWDANLEALRFMAEREAPAGDAWTRNAARNAGGHLEALRSGSAFRSIGHYNRITGNLNRLVSVQGRVFGASAGLSDFRQEEFSPARSANLLRCAERPERNPFFAYFDGLLLPALEARNPDWVGLSVNFLSQAHGAFALAGLIRRRMPRVRIVLGGGLVTSWMRLAGWRDPFRGLADRCVSGPGEAFFGEAAGGREASGPAAPDYAGLQDRPYWSPGFVLPYAASFGCGWRRCRFCPERAEAAAYSPLPAARAGAELDALCAGTRPSLIHFLDNALSPALLERLAARPPAAPWYAYARLTPPLTDPDFCAALGRSGCAMLKLGLESGDQCVLDRMDKGVRLEDAEAVLRNLKAAGIATYVYLLFGTPYESEPEALRTMAFAKRHAGEIGFIHPAIYNMPAHGEEAAAARTRPFSEGDLSLYVDFEHERGWDRRRVRAFLDRVFRRDPVLAPVLARTPRHFTSNHAPFFAPRFGRAVRPRS
jgi:hypothetical protein